MPDNKSLQPPSGKSATGDGSGVMIGDGVMLTAGHVMYEFNEKNPRGVRTLAGATAYYDPRNYFGRYNTAIANLATPLPTPSLNHTISSEFIEPALTPYDMVFDVLP